MFSKPRYIVASVGALIVVQGMIFTLIERSTFSLSATAVGVLVVLGGLYEECLRAVHEAVRASRSAYGNVAAYLRKQSEERLRRLGVTREGSVASVAGGNDLSTRGTDDMNSFACPSCGKKLGVDHGSEGESTNCPACGERFIVPFPTLAVETEPSRQKAVQRPQLVIPQRLDRDRRMVAVHVEAPKSNSLGVASLALGAMAFLICWIPYFGMLGTPLALLGVALGGFGVLVALGRKGTGIGYAIAGTATSQGQRISKSCCSNGLQETATE